jgi:tol-pal system protein YbgF
MRTRTALLLLAALLAVTGCASRDDVQYLNRDMDEVKNRIYQTEKELGSIRTETKEGAETALKDFQKEVENMRKTIADLQAAQDITRVDIQSLSGKVDDVRQMTQKPSEEMSLMKEDFERRLEALEGKLASAEKVQSEVHQAKEATPEQMYQGGLDAYKNNEIPKAREIFTKFISLHPKNELVANSHFWIGETYFSQKNYEQAILEYQEVITKFPGKEKVPAAMLKQAMAFKELGDAKSAKYIYNKLVETYPRSEEAKKAKERLKDLK